MKTYQTLYVSKANDQVDSIAINRILGKAVDYNKKIILQVFFCLEAVYFFNYSKAKKKTSKASSKKSRKTLATLTLLEFLSWNKLISAAKDLDNNIILHMLSRFKNVAIN